MRAKGQSLLSSGSRTQIVSGGVNGFILAWCVPPGTVDANSISIKIKSDLPYVGWRKQAKTSWGKSVLLRRLRRCCMGVASHLICGCGGAFLIIFLSLRRRKIKTLITGTWCMCANNFYCSILCCQEALASITMRVEI